MPAAHIRFASPYPAVIFSLTGQNNTHLLLLLDIIRNLW